MSDDAAVDAVGPAVEAVDPGVDVVGSDWRRLSRRMLLVHPVEMLIQFFPAVLFPLIFHRTADAGGDWWWQVGPTVLIVLAGVVRWFTTSYRVADGQLQLKTGFLQRSVQSAPLDRVRSVDLSAHPLHRVLGLSVMHIGTGAKKPFSLAGLRSQEAQRLRTELLAEAQRRAAAGAVAGSVAGPPSWPGAASAPAAPHTSPATRVGTAVPGTGPTEELVRFRPQWVLYAPFTTGGLLAALTIYGVLGQFTGAFFQWLDESGNGARVETAAASAGLAVVVLVLAVAALGLLALLSIGSYILTNWGFRLSREAGSLHTTRGLLTTRAASLDEGRIRGVALHRTLPMRWVGAAQTRALTTGYQGAKEGAKANDLLVPPADTKTARAVADIVLRDGATLSATLARHGQAARRRRYTRSLLGAAPLIGALTGMAWFFAWPTWTYTAPVLVVLAALALAEDRYRALGHAYVAGHAAGNVEGHGAGHVVVRSGSAFQTHQALAVPGIIGWVAESTWFQRRVGVVTLHAMTAARQGAVTLLDVPVDQARALIAATTPQLLR